MAQTQGTRRKVCYYYDGEHRARGGGGAGPGPGRGREREAEEMRVGRLGEAEALGKG